MDKIAKYKDIIKNVLSSHKGNYNPGYDEYESQLVFDDDRGHYLILSIGWDGYKQLFGCSVQIDIKNDKVWLQQDWTDFNIAEQLMEEGIPKSDIVLGFQAPYKRKYTGFAVS